MLKLAILGVLTLVFTIMCLHSVDEGHVGVYWTGGKLYQGTTGPGFHLKVPFITRFEQVQTSLQTDRVENIPCGTSGGVMVTFESIEVVNQLEKGAVMSVIQEYGTGYDQLWIFDKIHHEINQFCSGHSLQEVYIDKFDSLDESLTQALQRDVDRYAPGIRILAARVTKPQIPKGIMRNYERMEAEKTKLLISIERQRVVEKEAETERLKASIAAEKAANVSRITMERKIIKKQAYQKIQSIDNEMESAREKALADAAFYAAERKSEANKLKLTEQYLAKTRSDVIRAAPKVFFASDMEKVV